MRFAVIGAGLSGMCSALYLRDRFPTSEIVVWERSDVVGGRANVIAGAEHCARLFLDDYDALFDVLGRIPLGDGTSVLDSLRPVVRHCFSTRLGWVAVSHLYPLLSSELGLSEKVRMQRDRRRSPLLAEQGLGPNSNRYGSVRNLSPRSAMRIAGNFLRSRRAMCLPGATDQCLTLPFARHLESLGVKVLTGRSVSSIAAGPSAVTLGCNGAAEQFDAVVVTAFASDLADLLERSGMAHTLPRLGHIHCMCYTIALDPAEPVLAGGEPAIYSHDGITIVAQPEASRCVAVCTTCTSTDEPYVVGRVRDMLALRHAVGEVRRRPNLAADEAIWCADYVDPTRILRSTPGRIVFAGSYTRNRYPVDSGEAAARSARVAVDRLAAVVG